MSTYLPKTNELVKQAILVIFDSALSTMNTYTLGAYAVLILRIATLKAFNMKTGRRPNLTKKNNYRFVVFIQFTILLIIIALLGGHMWPRRPTRRNSQCRAASLR